MQMRLRRIERQIVTNRCLQKSGAAGNQNLDRCEPCKNGLVEQVVDVAGRTTWSPDA